MPNLGVVVLTDTKTHADPGRAVNVIGTVKEAKEHGDDIKFIFDGAGTKWLAELSGEDHNAHSLYKAAEDQVTGACEFCSRGFDVRKKLEKLHIPLPADYEKHPGLRDLAAEGYEVRTL